MFDLIAESIEEIKTETMEKETELEECWEERWKKEPPSERIQPQSRLSGTMTNEVGRWSSTMMNEASKGRPAYVGRPFYALLSTIFKLECVQLGCECY